MISMIRTFGLSALLLTTTLASGCGNEGAEEETSSEATRSEAATPTNTTSAPAMPTSSRTAEAEEVEDEAEVVELEPIAEDEADAQTASPEAVEDDGEMTRMASAGGDLPPDHPALGGDAAAGKRVFTKCMSCHSVEEGQNRVGPSLHNIVGRPAGSVENFNYTEANAESGIVWTKDVLFEYLEDPQGYIPGTRMVFPGLPDEEDRRNVIAYLEEASEE